jgi:hypothetical protein
MRSSARHIVLILCAVLLAVAGCRADTLTAPDPRVHVMEIAPAPLPCVAIYTSPCLSVRFDSDKDWYVFHERIEGFTYEAGYRYLLRVEVSEIPNPAADGGPITWRLLAVLAKVRE